MQKPLVQINIISDVVCPWCYIGKRRLEKALKSMENDFDFELNYLPFELNPDMPESGSDQKAYLIAKFGGEERFKQITQHVTQVAKEEGLAFNFDKQDISPNTKSAHRIIWKAKEAGKQLQVVEALFKAYFTDGVDLSRKENLMAIAQRAGLSKEEITDAMSNDESLQAVAMAQLHNRQLGVSGVPFYIINNKYAISGAQPAEAFIDAIKDIAQKKNVEGEVCDVDEKNC